MRSDCVGQAECDILGDTSHISLQGVCPASSALMASIYT